MIHIVMGGSFSGKTTFVKNTWLDKGDGFVHDELMGVPLSVVDYGCAIGHYDKPIRTRGVDQMGRNYSSVRWTLTKFLAQYQDDFGFVAMEGNALMDRDFMETLRKLYRNKVKIYLMNTKVEEIRRRTKEADVNYGDSIMGLSYKRAFKIYDEYKGVFAHEVVN